MGLIIDARARPTRSAPRLLDCATKMRMRLIGLALILSLTLAPLAAEAQRAANVVRIGLLRDSPGASPRLREAFLQGVRDLGYIGGRSLLIEGRDAMGKPERLPALAAELVASRWTS